MLRVLRRRALSARTRIAGTAAGRDEPRSASLPRARELLLLAQQQRDDARVQLRAARRQRDAVSAKQAGLRRQLAEAHAHRDRARAKQALLLEQVRSARSQRNEAGADRAALRDRLRAARAERETFRRELDSAVNGEFATTEQFDRLRRAPPVGASSNGSRSFRDLAYGPVGTQNPVLSLLYARCPEHGLLPQPTRKVDLRTTLPLEPGSIFNLHWTRFVQLGCDTASDASARSEQFLRWLEALTDRGVHLVWTIHEELPHDCPFPEIEIELRRELAQRSSLVHVLQPSTVELVKPFYELDPTKLLVVEHPLYVGIYPNYVTRETSRRMLDLADDEFTILLFGTIRPYKGVDRLLSAITEIRRRHPEKPVRLIIAGPTFSSVDSAQVILRAKATPGVTIEPRGIHSLHVQYLFRACDLVVLPYNEFLNSGVLLLALTFERPVLAGDTPVTRDMISSGLVRCFERTSDESLLHELDRAVSEPQLLPAGPLAPEFARRHDPSLLAGQLALGFRTMLDAVPTASGR